MDLHLFSIIFGSAVIIGATGFGVGLAVAMHKADEEMDEMQAWHRRALDIHGKSEYKRGYLDGERKWIKANARPVKQ